MSTAQEQVNLPGRLGDSARVMKTDPRVDPRLIAALAPFGMDGAPPEPPVRLESSLQAKLDYLASTEQAMGGVFASFFNNLPAITNVERRTEVVRGRDGNEIKLFIHRPRNASGALPCIYHLHGGGMVMMSAADPGYIRWRDELAAQGLVVVGAEFRNGGGKLGNYPFPAGLNDCMDGLRWTFEHKGPLGISRIIISGESGGGNLSLAVCLKAKQDRCLEQVAGVYALCPYIYGAWDQPGKDLPSLYENEGYMGAREMMAVLASVYDPERKNSSNPLCWPYRATLEDLRGLPPHIISVNELDALRDEGLAYYHQLLQAGVSCFGRTVNGTCHAADVLFPGVIPEVRAATLRDIKGFADSL